MFLDGPGDQFALPVRSFGTTPEFCQGRCYECSVL
jgi:hypothetical protein